MCQPITYWKSSNRWLVSLCVNCNWIVPTIYALFFCSAHAGCFNLDPNRVLDIILESFETRPEQNKLFVGLLKAYMPNGNIICEVLGYKYRNFSDTKTPSSLYIITALLLQSKIICLDDIYTWVRTGSSTPLFRSQSNFRFFSLYFLNVSVESNWQKYSNWLGKRFGGRKRIPS